MGCEIRQSNTRTHSTGDIKLFQGLYNDDASTSQLAPKMSTKPHLKADQLNKANNLSEPI